MAWNKFSTVPAAPIPIGVILPFGGISVPSGWAGCDGSAVSRSTYSLLFNALTISRTFTTTNASTSVTTGDTTGLAAGMFVEGTGITVGTTISSVSNSTTFVLSANATASGATSLRFFAFGYGDGSATFNLPDFRGRSPIGAGTGTGSQNTGTPLSGSGLPTGGSSLTARTVGQWGGQEQHQLATANMPSHTHTQDAHGHTGGNTGQTFNGAVGAGYVMGSSGGSGLGGVNQWGIYINNTTATNQNTGGGGAHNNLQPFAVTHYIIKAS